MRRILTVTTLLFSMVGIAQESFEGTIKYSMRTPSEKDTIQLQIDFAPNAIRVTMLEPGRENSNKSYLLVDFDSAKTYTIDQSRKSYTSNRLLERKPVNEVPPVKQIAGYTAIGELYNETGVNHIFGSILSNQTIFYTADKLVYNLPEKYNGNLELMMVQKNKIVLGAEINIAPRMGIFGRLSDEEDTTSKTTIYIEAKEISAKKFDAGYFAIPAGFSKKKPYTYLPDEMAMDTMTLVDSAVVTPAVEFSDTTEAVIQKPAPKRGTKKSPKKKATAFKQNAIKPKND